MLAESLRRQREDLEELMDNTLTRSSQAAELVGQLEDLRRRTEETQRRFARAAEESDAHRNRK